MIIFRNGGKTRPSLCIEWCIRLFINLFVPFGPGRIDKIDCVLVLIRLGRGGGGGGPPPRAKTF
jgi:hypothetical protein